MILAVLTIINIYWLFLLNWLYYIAHTIVFHWIVSPENSRTNKTGSRDQRSEEEMTTATPGVAFITEEYRDELKIDHCVYSSFK